MKKAIIITITIICAITVGVLSITAIKEAEPISNCFYALATEVVEINRETDVVTCEDSNGNLWEFYGAEDWQVGDNANLLMNSKGTPKIEDDEICGATYANWDLSR